jgi:acyl dehydratase
MTYPLTQTLGTDWLGHSRVSLRLLKPAYHGDRLSIELTSIDEDTYQVDCHNAAGVLLAQVTAVMPANLPDIDARAKIPGSKAPATREEIHWDAIQIDVPLTAVAWTPTDAENRDFTDQVADDLDVYREGVVHPHLIQHWCNQMLVRRFIMPAWIHVGTDMTFRRMLEVGNRVEVRAIPTEKWRHKGHEFIKLYVAFIVDGVPAVEATHTAIYKVAPKAG